MTKTRVRVTSCLLWVSFTLLGFYSPNPAQAETYTATAENRDFYFSSPEPMTLNVRTYAQQYGIDSMLWVYGENDSLITANDDYYGLDSFVSFTMNPGVSYRLRAGVCCGNPDAWYGNSYLVEPSMAPAEIPNQTTSTEVSTTTLPEPSTTSEPPTTTTTEMPTTTSTTTTTTQLPQSTTIPVVPETTYETTTSTTTSTTTTEVPTTTTTSLVVSTTTVPKNTTTLPPETTNLPETTTTTSMTIVVPITTTIPPITENMSEEAALAVATNSEVLETLTPEQAAEVFDAVITSELTDEEAEALVAAVQDAPESVRAEFEDKINIFSGKFNSYVPIGSTINVGQRKVLVAVSGALFLAPPVITSSSTPTSRRR